MYVEVLAHAGYYDGGLGRAIGFSHKDSVFPKFPKNCAVFQGGFAIQEKNRMYNFFIKIRRTPNLVS